MHRSVVLIAAALAATVTPAGCFSASRPLVMRASAVRTLATRPRVHLAPRALAARMSSAEATANAPGPAPADGGLMNTLKIGALFGVWYAFNIVYNISNKKILNAMPPSSPDLPRSVMSAIFLKSFFPVPVYLALLPVVGGVGIASLTELSFSWVAFLNAMASNTAFSARAIFSKKAMEKPQGENMGAANLYGVLTIMAFLMLLPVAAIVEGPIAIKAGWNAAIAGGNTAKYLINTSLVSGLFYYLYNEVAFLCLDNVHPITHAVGNTIKRVVIILASVVVFGTTMTPLNKIGSSLAIFGVLLYSLAKQYCK
ncbi:triose-phosphate transporter family-domain-containing protein [Pavlovales sp. CCMP2436]|nr:triose-phosphate transporter family-domain-containing protein [Pavlovales sp. CCMP2436]